MIYIIKEIDKDNRPDVYDLCKIGVSKSPINRVKQLQTGNPNELVILLILAPPPGMDSFDIENELHRRFTREHETGEWYRLTPRLVRFIDSHHRGNGEYPVYRPARHHLWTWLKWTFISLIILVTLCSVISLTMNVV